MKSNVITRRCLNCGLDTAKGLYCHRCDTVLYISWMIEDFHTDPHIRKRFIEELQQDKINSGQDLLKKAESMNAERTKRLATRITRMSHKFDYPAQCNIFARALRVATSKANAESEAIERQLKEVIECPESKLADEVAENILRQASPHFSTKNPDFTADWSKDQKAYAGFNHAQSEPDDLF